MKCDFSKGGKFSTRCETTFEIDYSSAKYAISIYSSNLNGVFLKGFPHGPKQTGEVAGQPPMEGTGIEWYPWKQQQYSMSHVEMKIRPSF